MAASNKQHVVFFTFMIMMAAASSWAAEVESEATPPMESFGSCIKDKINLGLCVHKEILNYITTRKVDFAACCTIVDNLTTDCYPFVTADPVFGLIYKKFCSVPPPSPPLN